MNAVAHHKDDPPATGPRDPTECRRCGGAVELRNVLPRLGERPSFRIFGCTRCSYLDWVAGWG